MPNEMPDEPQESYEVSVSESLEDPYGRRFKYAEGRVKVKWDKEEHLFRFTISEPGSSDLLWHISIYGHDGIEREKKSRLYSFLQNYFTGKHPTKKL